MKDGSEIFVVGVEAQNFHRLRFAEVKLEPGGRFVKVTGKNGAGKTSLLRAIRAALGGAGEVLEHAINDEAGAEEGGSIRIELTNGFTIERRFTEARPKGYLTVTGPDGGKHNQTRLNDWLGTLSFDPLAFFDLTPKRQEDVLMNLGSDPELAEKVEKCRADRAGLYEERTPWIATQRRARHVSRPEGERPERVDVSASVERLNALADAETELRVAQAEVESARASQEETARLVREGSDAIEELERKLAEWRKEIVTRHQADASARAQLIAAERRASEIQDPGPEIRKVKELMSTADRQNEALRAWDAWDTAQEDLEAATTQVEKITEDMDALRRKERAMIAEAGIPVPGLSFTEEGEPLLNGRPLEVASGAERIRLAVNVARAAAPDLHVCLVDEANDLDLEQLEELDKLAREHGFQVWGCRIGLEGPGEILVEDGEARSVSTVPVEF